MVNPEDTDKNCKAANPLDGHQRGAATDIPSYFVNPLKQIFHVFCHCVIDILILTNLINPDSNLDARLFL